MNIYAYNPDLTDAEKSYLSSGTLATPTTTILKVKNSNSFTNGSKVLIGAPGRERTEMVTQSANTPITITVGTTNFPHDADDPVYELPFDQVHFWRSTNGVNGSYTLLATVNIDWDNADGKTNYNDPNALDTYYYKVSLYDSINALDSDLSDPIQSIGYPDNSVGETIMGVVRKVNDTNFTIFDIDTWIDIMNDISKDLYKQAKRPYRFLKRNIPLDVGADDDSVPFPANIWKINYIEVNQYNATGSPLTFRPKVVDISLMRFRQSRMILPSDYVNEVAIDDEANALLFNPRARTDRLGAFNFHIYKKFDKFTDLSNLLETPDNLVYQFGLRRAFYLRKMDDDSKYAAQYGEFDKMYQAEIRMLQREKNIDAAGPSGLHPDRKRYPQFGPARYRQ